MLIPFPLHILPCACVGQWFSSISIYLCARECLTHFHSVILQIFPLSLCLSPSFQSLLELQFKHHLLQKHFLDQNACTFRSTSVLCLHLDNHSCHNSFAQVLFAPQRGQSNVRRWRCLQGKWCLPSKPRRTMSPTLAISVFVYISGFVPLRNQHFADKEHIFQYSKVMFPDLIDYKWTDLGCHPLVSLARWG